MLVDLVKMVRVCPGGTCQCSNWKDESGEGSLGVLVVPVANGDGHENWLLLHTAICGTTV